MTHKGFLDYSIINLAYYVNVSFTFVQLMTMSTWKPGRSIFSYTCEMRGGLTDRCALSAVFLVGEGW